MAPLKARILEQDAKNELKHSPIKKLKDTTSQTKIGSLKRFYKMSPNLSLKM